MKLTGCFKVLFVSTLLSLCTNKVLADTIPLQAMQTATRVVELSWEQSMQTTVMRQYPGENTSSQIAVINGNHYTDRHTRAVCDDTVCYTILQISSGDTNTGYATVNVSDLEATSQAEWGVVTVDPETQHIVLQWNPSPDTDIMGYIVCEGSPSIVVDTVFGRLNTTYTYIQGDLDEIYYFRIYAFDSCRLASALTDACCNMTVLLDAEPCSRMVTATWNSYQNMPGGLQSYELWISEDGAIARQVAETHDGEATVVQFQVAEQTMTVTAYVKALGSGIEAFSMRRQVTFATEERPAFIYLRKVSVSESGKEVTVVGQTDPSYAGTEYKVYRSTDDGASSVVGTCSSTTDGTLIWTDYSVQAAKNIYTYWFGVTDGCGRNEITSQKGSSILLDMEENNGNMSIVWNAYEGWEGITTYELMQSDIGNDNWESAAVTTGQNVGITSLGEVPSGSKKYKVIASEGGNSRWQRGDTLQSAVMYYRPQIDIWMSNAFTPHETSNNSFGPLFAYMDFEGYSFTIYNRQGATVFRTINPTDKWDGTMDGKMQPAGAYVYKITYRQNDGTNHEKIGTVIMIY